MEKLKETFLKKYGIWEYVLFLVGLAFLGRIVYSVIVADFKNMTWDEISAIILFFALGVLAISRPLAILELGRKQLGLKSKKNERTND
jgi:hypothetical protein